MVNKVTGENIVKNLLVLVIATLSYPIISNSLTSFSRGGISDLLFVISILLLFVGFTGFSFTYEKIKIGSRSERFLAHTITFISLLLTALLLEVMVLAIRALYPSFFGLILVFSLLLYIGVVLYDLWDLLKIDKSS